VHAESDEAPVLNRQLLRWEKAYNCVRATSPVPVLPHSSRVHHPLETQPSKGKVSLIYWTSTLR
jgi:hypothetical protein